MTDSKPFEKELNQIKMLVPKQQTNLARARNAGRWSGRGSDWATPKELYDLLDSQFHFTLDVCACAWNAKHTNYFTVADDALTQDWGHNICWMNPPYGKVLGTWMKKAYESAQDGATVVCLVPTNTDTAWWHDYAMQGEIQYLRKRPRFETIQRTWQQTFSPSVIVIFRPPNGHREEMPKEVRELFEVC